MLNFKPLNYTRKTYFQNKIKIYFQSKRFKAFLAHILRFGKSLAITHYLEKTYFCYSTFRETDESEKDMFGEFQSLYDFFYRFLKRVLIFCGVIIGVGALLFIFKDPLLRMVGNYLIDENEPESVEAMFVLSGGALERGKAAADLYKRKFTKKVICTGELHDPRFEALNIRLTEGQLTRKRMALERVDSAKIELLNRGTSTYEECVEILKLAEKRKYKKIMIVSSRFHTGRIRSVIENLQSEKENNINVIICGAPSLTFDEDAWWKSEDGLLFVNNEYVKSIYYFLKY